MHRFNKNTILKLIYKFRDDSFYRELFLINIESMLVNSILNLVLIYSVVEASSNWKPVNNMGLNRINLPNYFREKVITTLSLASGSPTSTTLSCPSGTEYCRSENNCKVGGKQPTEPNCCTPSLVIFQGDGLCYHPTFPPWGGNQCPVNYEYCSSTNTCKLITGGGGGNSEKCSPNTAFNTQDQMCHVKGQPPINGSCDSGDVFNPVDGLCH
jgi:hypothetical protein